MNEHIELLTATEYDTVAEALLELVRQYPEQIGVKAEYDALGANKSLAVLIAGGRVKKRDVLGGFTAEVNFSIAYKSQPKTSDQRLDRQEVVGKIAKWLENTKNLPPLTDNRTITKITARGVPYKGESEENGSVTYYADAVMEYKKKEKDPLL